MIAHAMLVHHWRHWIALRVFLSLVHNTKLPGRRVSRWLFELVGNQTTTDEFSNGGRSGWQSVLEPPIIDGFKLLEVEHQLQFFCALWWSILIRHWHDLSSLRQLLQACMALGLRVYSNVGKLGWLPRIMKRRMMCRIHIISI